MKLSIFLLCVGIGVASASTTYSQTKMFNLKVHNKSLKELFKEIERQSDYIFFYNDEAVDVSKEVNISANDATIYEILDKVLDKNKSDYKVFDRQIILFKNETKPVITEVSETEVTEQTRHTVTGIVRSNTNEPLIGVSVLEKGTANGVITDINGNYSINVSGPNATLVFSYIGFQSQEALANGRTKIDIILDEDVASLDEVVVVAYGTQRKSSVTGSMATVNAAQLQTVTSPSVGSMLSGKVAGVSALTSSGKPGEADVKIRVRGKTSPSTDQSPLWVVDGVIDGLSQQINPNDIESMTILKDASATALYGSRGANGVILVTTKGGRTGVNNLTISAKLGLTTLTQGNFSVMNSRELYEYSDSMFEPGASNRPAWLTSALMNHDVDWWDLVTQTAFSQNYNISHTFGNERMRSFLSGDYYGEEGTVRGYKYDRFTARLNTDYKINDKLSLRIKVSANYGETDDQSYSMSAANLYLPWDTPYNSDGIIKTGKEGNGWQEGDDTADYWFGRDSNNFLYDNKYNWKRDQRFGVNASFGFDYRFTDYLIFESTNNMTIDYRMRESYRDPLAQGSASDNGWVGYGNWFNKNRYANQLLRFNHTFNKVHLVSAFAGFEYYDFYHHETDIGATGIPSGGETLAVATTPTKTFSDKWMSKAMNYYFNANYTYDSRYNAQVSVRRDGSSRFGRDNRFGTFYTVSAAWNLHNEQFAREIEWLDLFKLRASYGSVGTTPTNMYQHMGLYTLDAHYNQVPAMYPHQMANRKLTWEKTFTTNVGFDSRIFDRLDITADFYVKNTSDLLYYVNLPTLTGYTGQYQNIGKVRNTGFELTLSPDIIKTKDWFWGMSVNLSYNKNEIKELYDGKAQISGNKIREVGSDLDTWYLREWAGVDPDTGSPLWIKVNEDGSKSLTGNVNDATRVKLGSSSPKFFGGLNTNLTYKNITFSANITYAQGHKIYHSSRQNYDHDGKELTYNSMKLMKGWSRWEKPGDKASHPKAMLGGNNDSNAVSSRYLEDGSYIKISNISLSYNLPENWLSKVKIKSASVSVSGENLYTLTKFSGRDPEVVTGDANSGAVGNDTYPVPRRVSLGLNVTF